MTTADDARAPPGDERTSEAVKSEASLSFSYAWYVVAWAVTGCSFALHP